MGCFPLHHLHAHAKEEEAEWQEKTARWYMCVSSQTPDTDSYGEPRLVLHCSTEYLNRPLAPRLKHSLLGR